jgi:hypothetical protein
MTDHKCWICDHPGSYDKSTLIYVKSDLKVCAKHAAVIDDLTAKAPERQHASDREPGEEG